MKNTTFTEFLKKTATLSYSEWRQEMLSHPIAKLVAEDLENVPQPFQWHPEYCTLKHTYTVVRGMSEVLGRNDLLPHAFFHDWGKQGTTLIQRSRISALGHAKKSEYYLRKNRTLIQEDLQYSDQEFENLCWVVQRHMDFDPGHQRFLETEKYQEPYRDLLCLVRADKVFARQYSEDLFKDEFPENYRKEQEELSHYQKFSFQIFMMIGIPGSGKSTWLSQFDDQLIIGRDKIRQQILGDINNYTSEGSKIVKREYPKLANQILEEHGIVLLDETGLFIQNRHGLLSALPQVRRTGVVFQVSPDEAKRRIANDIANGKDRSNVPDKVIDQMYKEIRWEWKKGFPEYHMVILVTENNDQEVIYDHDEGINRIPEFREKFGYD